MGRSGFAALTLALAIVAGVSLAQTAAQFDVGAREVGAVHPLRLTARNDNCPQNLNFRFDFAPSDWLRPAGDNRVRGVPSGQSRPLPALIDLTNVPPGRHTAEVDVVCENCQFLLIRNCGFDRQHLTISVDAVAQTAPATAAPAEPAPVAPPRRVDATPQPPTTTADTPPAPAPIATPIPAPSTEAEAACDCDTSSMQLIAALAGGAALVGFALAAWGFSAAQSARAASDAARMAKSPEPDMRQFLQDKIEELKELCETSRADLQRLLAAQIQAMRALATLGLVDREALAPEANAWTATMRDAGYGVDETTNTPVAGRRQGGLQAIVERAFGVDEDRRFTLFAATADAARTEHPQQLAWLRQRGFADSDDGAQTVLDEMASYMAHGASMRAMTERLRERVAECRQHDIDLARFVAGSG